MHNEFSAGMDGCAINEFQATAAIQNEDGEKSRGEMADEIRSKDEATRELLRKYESGS